MNLTILLYRQLAIILLDYLLVIFHLMRCIDGGINAGFMDRSILPTSLHIIEYGENIRLNCEVI